jgi:formate-dependent phosphoribosylglycinamide formyltransferase (GAR transformylase)
MDVILIEPVFPANQREFARALHAVGARVIGIGERPKEALDGDLREWLHHYEQVSNVCDVGALEAKVRWLQGRSHVQRLEATVEAHVMSAAKVRESCGIAGTSVKTAFLCRDKPAMKEALRREGIPCAASIGATTAAEVRDFAKRVGFPLILKPVDAAGAAGTYRADDHKELEGAMQKSGVGSGAEVAVEEYVEGHEAFYDTLTIGGTVVHEFVSHYFPGVLEAMRNRWISPQFISTNRIDNAETYDKVKRLGRKVNALFGLDTSATHMEWFFGPKGLKFSEIGCRPPGVRAWDLYSAGNEFDLYREWAMAIVHGRSDRKPSRRYSAGIIALRPSEDGTIVGYEGVEQVQRMFGEWFIDYHLPAVGSKTLPVSGGYMANAWMRLKHPDYDELRRMLDIVGQTVKVLAR